MRTSASGTPAHAQNTPHPGFTPGPWHEHSHRQIGPNAGIVCEVWSAIGSNDADAINQADANVRLISAAPELYQALVEILNGYRNGLAVPLPRTLKLIESVLWKVEGGAA